MMMGVILAGGENRRMGGKVKALLPFCGEALIERQIREMRKACTEIIVVASSRHRHLYDSLLGTSVQIVSDILPGKGPLSGMHAAWLSSTAKSAWIVACDMPFISADAALAMLQRMRLKEVSAAIPVLRGRIHPLHGTYDRNCLPLIEELLAQDELRVMALLQRICWYAAPDTLFAELAIDPHFVTNVNTPEDYLKIIEDLGIPGD
jgi:molybdopterin-guanine dinucleotide biosynthesis protein A